MTKIQPFWVPPELGLSTAADVLVAIANDRKSPHRKGARKALEEWHAAVERIRAEHEPELLGILNFVGALEQDDLAEPSKRFRMRVTFEDIAVARLIIDAPSVHVAGDMALTTARRLNSEVDWQVICDGEIIDEATESEELEPANDC